MPTAMVELPIKTSSSPLIDSHIIYNKVCYCHNNIIIAASNATNNVLLIAEKKLHTKMFGLFIYQSCMGVFQCSSYL